MSHLDRLKLTRRNTGPTWAQRKTVMERAGNACERCLSSVVNAPAAIHHRSGRRMGGRANANTAPNLVCLCDGCHRGVESQRTVAIADGWIVPSWCDPAVIAMCDVYGSKFFISDDGQRVNL